ncbi:hypothetical protein MMC22_011418 [Lobaria immixta]|nr:hypothetical protein [Lobaria immixta]
MSSIECQGSGPSEDGVRSMQISKDKACRILVALALRWHLLVRTTGLVEREALLEGELRADMNAVPRFERIHQIQQSQGQNASDSSREKRIETGPDVLTATPLIPDSDPLASNIHLSPTSDTFSDDAFPMSLEDYIPSSEPRDGAGMDADIRASYDGASWMLEELNEGFVGEIWPLATTPSSSNEYAANLANLSGRETSGFKATDPNMSSNLNNSLSVAVPGIISDIWPANIQADSLLPWIDVYFNRLHPTVPVLDRSSLYKNILTQEHRRNPNFGALLLALCAFALTQPVQIDERSSYPTRTLQAKSYLNEAVKMRSCSDFGENPTLEAILTSFFLFACLFGSNQHNAAWHRLREAIDLADTLGAYALQRQHSIGFPGRPSLKMRIMHESINNATSNKISSLIVHDDMDAAAMIGLIQLMQLFDGIDEDVINCWNDRCQAKSGRCTTFDRLRALKIFQTQSDVYQSQTSGSVTYYPLVRPDGKRMSISDLKDGQQADVLITQQWLLNRIWQLCYSHGLLTVDSEHTELRFEYAVAIASSTLEICKSLSLSSMEVHGVGLIEKIYNIAVSAANAHSYLSLTTCFFDPAFSQSSNNASTTSGSSYDIVHTRSSVRSTLDQYLKLLTELRGGVHPYLQEFISHLNIISVSV